VYFLALPFLVDLHAFESLGEFGLSEVEPFLNGSSHTKRIVLGLMADCEGTLLRTID
jgi:hypothetical protein